MRGWPWVGGLLTTVMIAAALSIDLPIAPLFALNPVEVIAPVNVSEPLTPSRLFSKEPSELAVFAIPEEINTTWLAMAALEQESVRQPGLTDPVALGVPEQDILPTGFIEPLVYDFPNALPFIELTELAEQP